MKHVVSNNIVNVYPGMGEGKEDEDTGKGTYLL